MTKQHAILPPSSADKWTVCHGWLKATEHLPNKSSIYAIEGTKAHEILETALRFDLPPDEVTKDTDLALNLSTVTEWLEKYSSENPNYNYYIEHEVIWSSKPPLTGTIDLAIVSPRELVVLDYKHGAGVVVEVIENKQLMLYLYGLIKKFGPRLRYKLVIVQPRAYHEDGVVREYAINWKELNDFMEIADNAIQENLKGGKRIAGEHCRFCTAAGTCKALAEYSLSIAGLEFTDD